MRLKACVAQMRQAPMPGLLALAALGLALHLALPRSGGLAVFRGAVSLRVLLDPEAWRALDWSPGRLVFDWTAMVLLMMPPLVSVQVAHVGRSVRRPCRPQALLAFGLGYGGCWVLAGAILVPAGLAASVLLPPSLDSAAMLAGALIWGASPPAQTARNRCHRLERIGADGQGALAHGVVTGRACLVTCWVWMMVPLTVAAGHSLTMLAVALYLFAERLAPAAAIRWRLPPGIGVLGGLKLATRPSQPPQSLIAGNFR